MSSSINGPSIFDTGGAMGAGGAAGTKGIATLVSGTVTVAVPGLTASSTAFVQPVTPIGTIGVEYKAVCSTNQLVITAVTTGLVTQVLDNSVVQYLAIQ